MADWNPGDLCQVRRGKRWVDAEVLLVEPVCVRVRFSEYSRLLWVGYADLRPRPAKRGKLPEPSENSRKAQEHFAATRESVVVDGGRYIISRPKSPEPDHARAGRSWTADANMPAPAVELTGDLRREVDWWEARMGQASALRPVPKPTTARSLAYLAHVRRHPCCSCGATEAIHAHHIAGGGMGAKCSDYYTAPLCGVCHQHWHATATLPAQSEFDVVDTDEARATMWEAAARCLEEWITREGE